MTETKTADEMAEGFTSPPPDTRPWCYWYWISDNVSKEGLTADLEAMARVGIGQAMIGNVAPGTPLGPVPLLSREWEECMTHAAIEAARVGVKLGVFNAPGWSQSGGPWLSADESMRYVAFGETRVKGPSRFEAALAAPKEHFQEVVVLAFPAPAADTDAPHPQSARCTPEVPDALCLFDSSPKSEMLFPATARCTGESLTIEFDYAVDITARSIVVTTSSGSFCASCELLREDEQGRWHTVREFVLDRRGLVYPDSATNVGFVPRAPTVVSFPAVTARRFRLSIKLSDVQEQIPGLPAITAPLVPGLAGIVLSGAARVDSAYEKQLAKMHPTSQPDWASYLWPPGTEPETPAHAVEPDRIVMLTDRIDADGILRWDVPAGEWVILRAGMTTTGTKNHPTTEAGHGYEADKMNRGVIGKHFESFVGRYLDRLPDEGRRAVTHVVIDSYEVGSQNWTDDFHETFRASCGYDPRPWLPVLTGRIVGSADLSDRFLWDLRRHISDRVATEYVGGLRDVAHRHGLRLWLENYGHWGYPGEFMQYGGQTDDLAGEFWIREGSPVGLGGEELRAASSAAHAYGKSPVYAEAFTSTRSFLESPANMKTLGDWAFCHGISHFVLHVYIHQPWADRKPGVTAWFGTEFNRHNTWFEPAKAWIDYLRRCHFMLRQGINVADIAYFIGDDAPKPYGPDTSVLPDGYDYDYLNAEVLEQRVRVENGRMVLPDGVSYALLVLPSQETMRPATLRRIRDLVADGAAVFGAPPSRSPSLADYPACDDEVRHLAMELWGDLQDAPDRGLAQRAFGRGRVFRGDDMARALRELGVEPAVRAPADLLWTHRRDGEREIFFVSNQSPKPLLADVSFRVAGVAPELWHPDSGGRQTTAWFECTDGRTRVPLAMDGGQSLFVVFRRGGARSPVVGINRNGAPVSCESGRPSPVVSVSFAAGGGMDLRVREPGRYELTRADGTKSQAHLPLPGPRPIDGPWTLRLPLAEGERSYELPSLVSWHEHPNEAVRHFSGTAVYTTRFEVPEGSLGHGLRMVLELGAVEVIAEAKLNGKQLGVLWKHPYEIDVTEALGIGANELELRVTNLWWNRLAGDELLPPEERRAANVSAPAPPRGTLQPSGLLGPVRLRTECVIALS